MHVKIKSVDPRESVSVPGTSQLGYPLEFETPFVSGFATIVPSPGGTVNLAPGRAIEVDAKQEYISKFRKIDAAAHPKMEPLDSKGDYFVQGSVIFCYEAGTFGVEVGGFLFTLDRDDALGQLPETDQRVSFQVHGLSLWDRNR